jgi:hypothetical protein
MIWLVAEKGGVTNAGACPSINDRTIELTAESFDREISQSQSQYTGPLAIS